MHDNLRSRAKTPLWLTAAVLCTAGLFVAAPRSVAAQASAPKAKAPVSGSKAGTTAPSRAAPAAKAREQRPDDAAAREQILRSQKWQSTMQAFDEWLSAQSLYDAEQVKHIRARLAAGIGRMNAAQLQWFLTDMQEKLQVLNSQAARDADAYLAETFAVASPAYARKLRQKLPDVLAMTASQVKQQLVAFAAKQQQKLAMQKTFDDSKQQQIVYNQAQIAEQQQVLNRDLDRESTAVANASKGNNFNPARDYFPDVGNDGPFGPGTSVGFWGGGFF